MEQSRNSSYKAGLCPSSIACSITSRADLLCWMMLLNLVFPVRERGVFNLLPWSLYSHVIERELEAQLYWFGGIINVSVSPQVMGNLSSPFQG